MPIVECPNCGATIELEADIEDGETVTCPECGAEYIVVRRGRRIRLEPLKEEEEYVEEEEY